MHVGDSSKHKISHPGLTSSSRNNRIENDAKNAQDIIILNSSRLKIKTRLSSKLKPQGPTSTNHFYSKHADTDNFEANKKEDNAQLFQIKQEYPESLTIWAIKIGQNPWQMVKS